MAESNSDELWETADSWKAAAIALAIGTPSVCAFFFPWVYSSTTDLQMLQRVQIVGSLAAFGVALITFCTVVWRGLIATQQAKLQRIQIEKLTAQIAATDENNLALRLQKGAELLSDPGKRSHVAAGLVSLEAVANTPNSPFAIEAMNLIADFVDEQGKTDHLNAGVRLAIEALGRITGRTRLIAQRTLDFSEPTNDDTDTPRPKTYWRLVRGVGGVYYNGGNFFSAQVGPLQNAMFDMVTFTRCAMDIDQSFVDCTFERCKISSAKDLSNGTFVRCDFSGAKIGRVGTSDLRHVNCYYEPTNPPVCTGTEQVDWSEVFLEGDFSRRSGSHPRPPKRAVF
ncbi:hypothetical protein [Mesorhizobium sp. B4-1-1]|uniref:hypothetical protein n=1 Tax=Mesorhizobium sp. B4-1-1 TaxID=2589890 RepID=UPI0011280F12|nr:hypothetical protein [Mesorhizobium sp. B4-1-1]TPI17610.1 hypothetical protein FJW10_21490 [Mesorhizobium sp. B4-1-1]